MIRITKLLFLLLAVTLVVSSCKKDVTDETENTEFKKVADFDNEATFEWNETYLQVERYAAGYRPGPAPRSVAYLGLSAYEACIAGMPDFNSFDGYWAGFDVPDADRTKEYHWPLVVNASYEYLMPRFFARVGDAQQTLIRTTAKRLNDKYKAEVSAEVYDRSVNRGREVAEVVWEWSKTDIVGHDHYLDPFQGYDWEANFQKTR